MTAASPYTPFKRNSFLHKTSSQRPQKNARKNNIVKSPPQERFKGALFLGVLIISLRFWKAPNQETLDWIEEQMKRTLPTKVALQAFKYVQKFLIDNIKNKLNTWQFTKQLSTKATTAATTAFTFGTSTTDTKKSSSSLSLFSTTSPSFARFHENQQAIKSVIMYWFGQYSPEDAQKRLWMIAASSIEWREKIDLEITQKFESLLCDLQQGPRLEEWCQHELYGYSGKVAAITALDQFSRHIHRYKQQQQQQSLNNTTAIPATKLYPQSQLDKLAFQIAQLFVNDHELEIQSGIVPTPMYIFSLMPYRHNNTLPNVKYVHDCIENNMENIDEQVGAMVRRFRKATNRRMALLQDKARREGTNTKGINDANNNKCNNDTATTTSNQVVEEDKPDTTTSDITFEDFDILETFPFQADLSRAKDHLAHRTMESFLPKCSIYPWKENSIDATPLASTETTTSPPPPPPPLRPIAPVIVSLSGGVDSMVIASILVHLKKSCGYPHLHVIAVHIDYANRPESGAEANYVKKFCNDNDIECHVTRIDTVTRGVTNRDDYERITRTIRYDSYRQIITNLYNNNDTIKIIDNQNVIGVMLGHHRGDLRENVLSNAHRGCGPLDLSGMTCISQNNGITIYRPLLPLEKHVILDYAHKFGVPYFKDTTPHWSTRGKLRNKLLPLLEDIYGEGSMNNLSNLAVESDDCRELVHYALIEPFLKSITKTPMGIMFDTTPWKTQPVFFWKFVMREALHGVGLGMFSDKSILSFLERVQAKTVRNSWLQCRKDYGVYLRNDGTLFILYPNSFPWRKSDEYDSNNDMNEKKLLFGTDNSVQIGPWSITAEIIIMDKNDNSNTATATAATDSVNYLGQKAIPSMEHLMNGTIEYYIACPTWNRNNHDNNNSNNESDFVPRPLVFKKQFTKKSRPLAWKNSDLKVEEKLPIVGNDNIAFEALQDPISSGAVHEEETLLKIVGSKVVPNPIRLVRITIRLAQELFEPNKHG